MKNIFSHSKSQKHKYQREIIKTEISDWQSKNKLPRHISAPETESHRGGYNPSKINYAPRLCEINPKKPDRVNLAINIIKYQLRDRTARQKHLENLRSNLNYRLQVAKSQKNERLLNILQDEYKQLETSK